MSNKSWKYNSTLNEETESKTCFIQVVHPNTEFEIAGDLLTKHRSSLAIKDAFWTATYPDLLKFKSKEDALIKIKEIVDTHNDELLSLYGGEIGNLPRSAINKLATYSDYTVY